MIKKFDVTSLSQWLNYLENGVTGGKIEMGLARIEAVRKQMKLLPTCPVIVVAGTNGKGSVCAYLTQIYHEAGYRVGTLTSPHLLRFNERIAVNGQSVSDAEIISAFACIEAARGETVLTYFEFNTLAAVHIFNQQAVDVMILEVGLGGRLDAVNIFNADVSVITSVDLDHQAFLGDTIEQIAFEKAGVMRAGKPIILGQQHVPFRIETYAQEICADLLILGMDFAYHQQEAPHWAYDFHPQHSKHFVGDQQKYILPLPALQGSFQLNNAACALTVLTCLQELLPVEIAAIRQGLLRVQHLGRFQLVLGKPVTILDVGHNPHAARALRHSLKALPTAEKRLAVFSMLSDKDIDAVLEILHDQFDQWFIAPLATSRGLNMTQLQASFAKIDVGQVYSYANIQLAYQAALTQAKQNDRIVIFGSFHTVAEILTLLT
ncbi:MAG: bifunctional tetrahydrofolate synthase/dihydrofolate synthase [Snodgrassella sp.]|nr:bifunctional tetrahydrofolate synthase/dihydrofolate synthase [Snodgrassella sp.]